MDYKTLYYELFNKLSDVIDELKQIQCQMEDMYINNDIENNESEDN